MYSVIFAYENKINSSCNNTWEYDVDDLEDVKNELAYHNNLNFLGDVNHSFAAWIAGLDISFRDEKVFNYDNQFVSVHVRVKKENENEVG